MNNRLPLSKIATVLITITLLGSACQSMGLGTPTESPDDAVSATPGPTPADVRGEGNPFAPQPGDDQLNRGEVQLNQSEVMIMESFPVQITVHLEGSLPTPCHQLRVSIEGDPGSQEIRLDVYSVVDPDEMCAQVLEPFEANIPLGSFEDQGYTFWVNGEQIGEY